MSQEEKATLIADNQSLSMQVQELFLETEKLREDLKLFNSAKETLPLDYPNAVELINT